MKSKNIVCCLDLEGVLIPEIWINVAKKTGVKALERTTREEPNYDKLMRYRLGILRRHGIKLKDIRNVIAKMRPLPGARVFLDRLRSKYQVIILSDTFTEFAEPLMKQLGWPTIFCHTLAINSKGFIAKYLLRQSNQKAKAVKALRALNFCVLAAGDSYNDIPMLKAAHQGFLFRSTAKIKKQFPRFKPVETYPALLKQFGIK